MYFLICKIACNLIYVPNKHPTISLLFLQSKRALKSKTKENNVISLNLKFIQRIQTPGQKRIVNVIPGAFGVALKTRCI